MLSKLLITVFLGMAIYGICYQYYGVALLAVIAAAVYHLADRRITLAEQRYKQTDNNTR